MCGIIASFTYQSAQGITKSLNPLGHNGHHTDDHTEEQQKDTVNGSRESHAHENSYSQLKEAIESIKHRGPDGSGVWLSSDAKVGLAHCRLSIIDPSPSGAQPLHSDDGLIHAVVNGEIYDHDRLRDVCSTQHGYTFSSQSDSELVIALYKVYGAPQFLEHLRGEFAFVLHDERPDSKRVIGARDRFGIKPLFWTDLNGKVVFASEAKAFLPLGWAPEWDVDAIAGMDWMINDRTVFKNVRKVLPGHWFELTEERGLKMHQYWDAEYPDKTIPEPRSIDEMVLGVRQQLLEAVRLRLRADVPVGIYLSGGIDSSAIAGMVTELVRKEKVKVGSEQDARVACFTIRFPNESGYNESDVADRTAEWLNVQIVKLDITEQRLADDFADCVYHSEHHHFDLNSVAKFGLSTLPSKLGVKAILTGEGSDEHFSGYLYYLPEYLREADASLPDSELTKDSALREELQKKASFEMGSIWKSQGWKEYEGIPGVNLDALQDLRGNKMPNTLLTARPPDALFPEEIRRKYEGSRDMRETMLASYTPEVREKMREKWHPANTAMYIGNKSSFPNVLLSCLGDRTEMAHSIEARTPFLDHHLTNYVNTLPPSTKLKFTPPNESNQQQGTNFWLESRSALQSFTDKWILREAVRPYITDELYNRRKFPFLAPARWPKDGPLHKMFKELLTPEAVENLGFIDSGLVAKALEDGFSDKANPMSFRTLCYVGSWVVLARKFGIKKACVETSNGV